MPSINGMEFTDVHQQELRSRLQAENRLEPERIELRERAAIVRYKPEYPRVDESTVHSSDPAIPLVFIRGMGESAADEWYLETLARMEQREVIGVVYDGRLQGKARPAKVEGLEGTISEIDVTEAADVAAALEKLGITQVDLAAESRGAQAAIMLMRGHPELVRNATLEHPGSLNRRTPRQRYVDAAREGVARIYRNMRTSQKHRVPEAVGVAHDEGIMLRMRNSHTEQLAVARARLEDEFAQLSPNIHVIVTGDRDDKAFRSEDLAETVRIAQAAGAQVEYEETSWGGHGLRYNGQSMQEMADRLRRLERSRATELAD
ncbi:alpha/beta hydrolase [bacterium]|nr:MAG: alpha/beta hydrolase [bacterium]